jgi:hypothetical protein
MNAGARVPADLVGDRGVRVVRSCRAVWVRCARARVLLGPGLVRHGCCDSREGPYQALPRAEVRSLGYLMNIVYTRDVRMHRVDICRATGRQLVLTAGHHGRLIADMVADWASTHHHPCALRLTGPAGGTYASGDNGPHLEIDATHWAWIISGRARGTGLLATPSRYDQRPAAGNRAPAAAAGGPPRGSGASARDRPAGISHGGGFTPPPGRPGGWPMRFSSCRSWTACSYRACVSCFCSRHAVSCAMNLSLSALVTGGPPLS